MEIKSRFEIKEPEYPYLAIWTGGDPLEEETVYGVDRLVLITKGLKDNENQIWVSYLSGSQIPYLTTKENEYKKLPIGTVIELVQ